MLNPGLIRILLLLVLATIGMAGQVDASEQQASDLEKVSLQLKWFHQFQFAGYYAAIEKGYYAEAGLSVEIRERILKQNFIAQVASGVSEYGVSDSGLISQYANGAPVTALAAIFQHNPLVFITKQGSGIVSPFEMVGKRVMSDIVSFNEAPLRAMLVDSKINDNDYTLIPQGNDYSVLIRNEVDVISGYLTDQPYFFKQHGQKINIINPLNYGIDFYGDILFTNNRELQTHPDRVDRFLRASLKGWQYALDHPEELIQIIHDKYHSKLSLEHLRFEAEQTRKLILPDVIKLGHIDPARMKRVADTYAASGIMRMLTTQELDSFVYQSQRGSLKLTREEQDWLIAHPVIQLGIDRDFAPYEQIDMYGDYFGMAADYIRLIEKKLGIRFELVYDRPWVEILNMAQSGELDMLACAVATPERSKYLSFTKPYKSAPAVIIDNGQGDFIGDLDHLAGKKVVLEQGYFIQEFLTRYHPDIHLVFVGDTKSALKLVSEGKADAYVGDAARANYLIKKEELLSLRFSGQTDYFSQHSLAISKAHPLLFSIMTKARNSISKTESDAIFDHWLSVKFEQGVKTEVLFVYALAIAFGFLLFGYWVYRLRREISERRRAEQQVQELLIEQKAMLDSDLIGIVKVKKRRILWTNVAFEKMLGYEHAEMIGKSTAINFISQSAYQELGEIAYPVLMAGGIFRTQIEHVCKNGNLIWVDLSGSMLNYDKGESLWAFVEITKSKQAEEKLRTNALYSRSLIEASLDPLLTISTDGNIMDVNQATEKITGFSRHELIGSEFSNYFTEPEKARSGYRQVFAHGQVTDFPLIVRHKSGQLSEVLYNATVYCDLHGKVQGIFAAARDITERKKMEITLANNERHFATLLSTTPVGVFEADPEGKLTYVNQRWSEITGLGLREARQDGWTRCLHPDDRELVISAWFASCSKHRRFHLEYRFCRADGKVTWVLGQSHHFLSATGELLGYIGSITDISELKQMENSLRQARDLAEQAAKTKSIFLANMSHEVRTPMNAIIGLSQLALNHPLSDQVRDYLQKINTSSVDLLGILNDILDFSKMEAGKLNIEYIAFDLNRLLSNLYDIFQDKAQQKKLKFLLELAPETPVHLIGDALRIQQILSNLLTNAFKFTDAGSVKVRVSASECNETQAKLLFCVSDTGIGIAKPDQAKLFKPFSQVDASITRRFGGTGLGLAISQKLLSLMGSHFKLESVIGAGSNFCFELILSLAQQQFQPTERRQRIRNPGTLSMQLREQSKELAGCRILVAEDNAVNQQVVQEFLKLSGMTAEVADNGIAALRMLQTYRYDAVIMDVHMPEMGGVEATQYIRKQARYRDLPIIALSAGVTDEEKQKCLACGMNDFIAKPLNPEELINVLNRWIHINSSVLPDSQLISTNATQARSDQCGLKNLTGFNFDNVLLMTGGDEKLVLELLRDFYRDYAGFKVELDALLATDQFHSAEKLLHGLKGVAGNLGAIDLHAAAEVLDSGLKHNQLDDSAYLNFMTQLEYSQTQLRQFFSEQPS